jgi:hypothetical protein
MRHSLTGAIVALAMLPAAAAHAQSRDDLARADALFNAGKALTDAGQFADACAKFAESKRLAPGLGVTLYLADCYEHIARNASAWTEFRSAEGLARERNDKRADVARARAQALEPKLNRLTIALSPSIPRSGLQILRDGTPVAQEELGLPVPVDRGAHVVVVSSPAHKTHSFEIHTDTDGQTATVQVDALDDEQPATPPPLTPAPPLTLPSALTATPLSTPPAAPDQPPTSDTAPTRRWIGLSIGALGVVGVGVGSALGLMAKSKLNESNSGPCDATTDRCDVTGLGLRKDAGSLATGSTIAFVAGGVALATGVVLFVTARSGTGSRAVVVAPVPLTGGGGAIVRAAF